MKYLSDTLQCDNNPVCAVYPLHTRPFDILPGSAHFVLCARDLIPSSKVELPMIFQPFTCADSSFIGEALWCDSIPDCPGAEDEVLCSGVCTKDDINCFVDCIYPACTCHEYYYQCISGGCMTFDKFCNGRRDCPLGEDEQGCVIIPKVKYEVSTFMQLIDIATGFCMDMDSNLPCTSLTECYSLQSLCHYDTKDGIILYCADGTHLGEKCAYHVCNYEYKCLNSYCIPTRKVCIFMFLCCIHYHCAKKSVTTMLTYPWKCTVLHCNHLGNTWKPLVLMTRHFDYCPSASECTFPGVG